MRKSPAVMHFDLIAFLRFAVALDGIGDFDTDFFVLDGADVGGGSREDC